MKKTLVTLLLCLVLLCAVAPSAALAADLPFTDVPASEWYYGDIKNAYDMKLIDGKTKTTFCPKDNLTYAEAAKLAACMHQVYMKGSVTLTNGNPWYQSYVDYCKENKIITKDYTWTAKATRAGYMEIFSCALPDYALPQNNTVEAGSIPDVPATHPQAEAIYKLYRAGILQGNDAEHNCNPSSNIKRSEVAAILTRMMDSSERLSFTIGDANGLKAVAATTAIGAVKEGEGFTVSAQASGGTSPYTYQWYWAGPDEKYYDMSTYAKFDTAKAAMNVTADPRYATQYMKCLVTDAKGKQAFTNSITITLNNELTVTPSQTYFGVKYHDSVTMSVAVSGGTAPYSYQWYMGSSPRSGDTKDTIKFVADTSATFYCVVTDAAGKTATSDIITMTVEKPLNISTQPQSQTIKAGNSVTLSVAATGGSGSYTYKWYSSGNGKTWNSTPFTSSSVTVTPAPSLTAAYYKCEVSDGSSTVTSDIAVITLNK